MADEKVYITLILDDKEVTGALKGLPSDFKKAGDKSGNSFAKGFKRQMSGIAKKLTAPFREISGKFLALGASIAGGFLFKKAIDQASKLETSLTGLKSVTESFGGNVENISSAAQRLAADGLIPMKDVTASLKTLMLNFNGDMERSVQTFESFRDAAAFGRQGALSLGEAIVGASEGLKNDMSIKVDNAGVTRNLSLMQKDYAEELGISVGKLTEAQKTEAEYLGVKKEAARFQGDYNKLLNTFSGAQSKVAGSTTFLLAELGGIVTKSPLVVAGINDTADSIQGLTEKVKDFSDNGGLKRVLLASIQVGTAVNTYLIKPYTYVLDVIEIAYTAYQTFFTGLISGYKKVGSFVGKFLEKLGLQNNFTKKLISFDPGDFEGLKEQFAVLKEKIDNAFSGESSDKIAEYFEKMKQSILSVRPALDVLTQKQKDAKAASEAYAETAKQTGKAVAGVFNQTMVKAVSFGVQSIVNSLITGEFSFKSFSSAILGMLGDMAIQMGQTLLLTGIGIQSLFALNGAAAVAAGIGLIALGTIVKSFAGGGESAPSAGGGGSSFAPTEETIDDDEPVEREEQNPGVNITIRGDVLDSNESGMRIVDIINKAYDQEGVVINRGAIA